MRTKPFYLIPFGIILSLLLNTSYKSISEETIKFSGNIIDLKDDSLFLFKTDGFFPGLQSDFYIAKTKCSANGDFSFTIPKAEAGYYQIVTNNYGRIAYDIYLSPGDDITLYQSPWREAPTFRVRGKGSEKLAHLQEDFEKFHKNSAFYKKLKSNQFTSLQDFKSFLDSIEQGRIGLVKKQAIPKPIKQRFIQDIKIESATFFLEHLKRRNYIMTGEFRYFLPEESDLPAILSELDSENFDSYLSKKLLEPYLEYRAQKQLAQAEESNNQKVKPVFKTKLKLIENTQKGKLRDYLSLAVLSNFSLAMFEDNFFENIRDFGQEAKDAFVQGQARAIFKQNFQEFAILQPGKTAPNISLPNKEGEIVKLSDFRGKVVYIDFWGTWCAPCIQEIPYSLQLQKDLKEEKIVFLFVALQSGEKQIAEWKDFIEGKNERAKKYIPESGFPGKHLVAEGQFSNPELSPYKLNFAPTYMIIDQEGKIVDTRASRPSEVKSELEALLKNE